MHIRGLTIGFALSVAVGFGPGTMVKAQGSYQQPGAGGVNMMFLPVERGNDGNQYIITRNGSKVTVPGLGIAPNASSIQVYNDAAHNFWYIDRNGQPTAVTPQQLQMVAAQMSAQAHGQMPPQGTPYQQYPQQAPMPQQSAPYGNPGASALATGMAAAGGAALGSAMTNSYYNNNPAYASGYHGVPYGVPLSMESAGHYYYHNPAGTQVTVAPTTENTAAFNEWNKQGSWNNRQQWAQAAESHPGTYQEQSTKAYEDHTQSPGAYQQHPQSEAAAAQHMESSESGASEGRRFGRRRQSEGTQNQMPQGAEQSAAQHGEEGGREGLGRRRGESSSEGEGGRFGRRRQSEGEQHDIQPPAAQSGAQKGEERGGLGKAREETGSGGGRLGRRRRDSQ